MVTVFGFRFLQYLEKRKKSNKFKFNRMQIEVTIDVYADSKSILVSEDSGYLWISSAY